MIRAFGVLAILILCGGEGVANAQEIAVLNTPIVTTVTSHRIVSVLIEREPEWKLTITYRDSSGKVFTDEHKGPATIPSPIDGQPVANPAGAETLIRQLNVGNFSTVSMTRRLLQHLEQHGKIGASTITGTPEGAQ